MELNGNLLLNKFYKFDKTNNIIDLDENDYKKLIDNKTQIKIQFPLGINGIMSDIFEYNIDQFDISRLITIINNFYNSKLTQKEKETLFNEAELDINNLNSKKDVLRLTNQCFLEEIEYKNGVYILRTGS